MITTLNQIRHLIPEVELEKYDKVLKVIEDYAYGKATLEELKEAWESTIESAWESAWASVIESAHKRFKEFLEELENAKVISLQESLIGLGLYDRYYKMYYDVNAGNFGWKLGEEIERFSKLKGAFQPTINYSDKIDALRWAYGYIKPPKKNFRVFQESPFCNFTELWNDIFSTSLEAKRKILSLKDKFKEGTKLSIFEVKEEYTIETEVNSFNKLKRV